MRRRSSPSGTRSRSANTAPRRAPRTRSRRCRTTAPSSTRSGVGATFGRLVAIDVKPGSAADSQSGLNLLKPTIYGRLAAERCGKEVAFVVIHPSSNFFGHYLLGPLERRGRAILALNTRFAGNDATLTMERCIQDLGAGIAFLRSEGFKHIVLLGNSGGGSLAAFYQSQAERLTITDTPDGRPIELSKEDLPPVDGLAMCAAHPGRAQVLTDWLDPSVTDETDMLAADPALDMYHPKNGPPYDRAWLERYRAAPRAAARAPRTTARCTPVASAACARGFRNGACDSRAPTGPHASPGPAYRCSRSSTALTPSSSRARSRNGRRRAKAAARNTRSKALPITWWDSPSSSTNSPTCSSDGPPSCEARARRRPALRLHVGMGTISGEADPPAADFLLRRPGRYPRAQRRRQNARDARPADRHRAQARRRRQPGDGSDGKGARRRLHPRLRHARRRDQRQAL